MIFYTKQTMTYLGELISIGVAFSWTATALLSEFGSKRLGNLTLNVLRMALALVFSLVLFAVATGSPLPAGASFEAAGWMLLSGLVGYVIGDFCLFQCYIIIGSRYGQLFMTLAPLAAALMAWVTLGQQMNAMSIVAMLVTLLGISISVLGRGEHHKVSLKLPLNGVLFAIGAAVCQGIGLVLSKIGMDHYVASADMPEWLVPFNANFYRCVAGIIGFSLLLWYRDGFKPLREAMHDKWTFRWGGLLAHGCAVYWCWHRLHPDGYDAYHYHFTFLLALPRENHLACRPWCHHLRRWRQPVFPELRLREKRKDFYLAS